MSNGIVKLAEEIRERYDLYLGEEGKWEHEFPKLCHIILSHAPVIDAEKLADEILLAGFKKYERSPDNEITATEVTLLSSQETIEITHIITSNLNLRCAPVIDAEKLAEKMFYAFSCTHCPKKAKEVAQLITDSIDRGKEK